MQVFLAVLFAGWTLPASGRGNQGDVFRLDQFSVETRLGAEGLWQKGATVHDNTGFRGQYLNLRIDGQIVDGLSYSYRQRLNKGTDRSFWDATDWLHLDWQASQRWQLSAGKQVVGIGGYEYDRAPIDLYYCSEFWCNIPCYQLGVSASYKAGRNDKLLAQVCNSPFRTWAGNNTYAINLMWYGKHAWWETMWSVNMMQYGHGKWLNYIALGNRFRLDDKAWVDVDLMNRAASHQAFLLKDCSVMSELSIMPHHSVRCFAGYTFDTNKSGTDADKLVVDGTCLHRCSAGCEYMPLKAYPEALRLFATVSYGWGENANPQGTIADRDLRAQAGLKFRMDILEGINQIMKHYQKTHQ